MSFLKMFFNFGNSTTSWEKKDGIYRNGHLLLEKEFVGTSVWLRSIWGNNGLSQYYYSLDGDNFIPFGHPYQLSWGNYRGDRIGVYCYNNNVESGYVDIDYFHYEME